MHDSVVLIGFKEEVSVGRAIQDNQFLGLGSKLPQVTFQL